MRGKVTARSGNKKTGPIPVTSRAQDTCPTLCPFYGNGCYGENRGANPRTLFQIAEDLEIEHTVETLAAGMRQSGKPGKGQRRQLPIVRDREVGDLLTPEGEIDREWMEGVADAAALVGRTVFGYTHVPDIWGQDVPMGYVLNASCEDVEGVYDAWNRGLPAVVVGHIDEVKAVLPRAVACPAESRGVTCAECGLCAMESRMGDPEMAPVIVFEPHGQRAATVNETVAGLWN